MITRSFQTRLVGLWTYNSNPHLVLVEISALELPRIPKTTPGIVLKENGVWTRLMWIYIQVNNYYCAGCVNCKTNTILILLVVVTREEVYVNHVWLRKNAHLLLCSLLSLITHRHEIPGPPGTVQECHATVPRSEECQSGFKSKISRSLMFGSRYWVLLSLCRRKCFYWVFMHLNIHLNPYLCTQSLWSDSCPISHTVIPSELSLFLI